MVEGTLPSKDGRCTKPRALYRLLLLPVPCQCGCCVPPELKSHQEGLLLCSRHRSWHESLQEYHGQVSGIEHSQRMRRVESQSASHGQKRPVGVRTVVWQCSERGCIAQILVEQVQSKMCCHIPLPFDDCGPKQRDHEERKVDVELLQRSLVRCHGRAHDSGAQRKSAIYESGEVRLT